MLFSRRATSVLLVLVVVAASGTFAVGHSGNHKLIIYEAMNEALKSGNLQEHLNAPALALSRLKEAYERVCKDPIGNHSVACRHYSSINGSINEVIKANQAKKLTCGALMNLQDLDRFIGEGHGGSLNATYGILDQFVEGIVLKLMDRCQDYPERRPNYPHIFKVAAYNSINEHLVGKENSSSVDQNMRLIDQMLASSLEKRKPSKYDQIVTAALRQLVALKTTLAEGSCNRQRGHEIILRNDLGTEGKAHTSELKPQRLIDIIVHHYSMKHAEVCYPRYSITLDAAIGDGRRDSLRKLILLAFNQMHANEVNLLETNRTKPTISLLAGKAISTLLLADLKAMNATSEDLAHPLKLEPLSRALFGDLRLASVRDQLPNLIEDPNSLEKELRHIVLETVTGSRNGTTNDQLKIEPGAYSFLVNMLQDIATSKTDLVGPQVSDPYGWRSTSSIDTPTLVNYLEQVAARDPDVRVLTEQASTGSNATQRAMRDTKVRELLERHALEPCRRYVESTSELFDLLTYLLMEDEEIPPELTKRLLTQYYLIKAFHICRLILEEPENLIKPILSN